MENESIYIKVVAILVPVFVLFVLRVFSTAKRITKLEDKTDAMETNIQEMDERHNLDIEKIQSCTEGIKSVNAATNAAIIKLQVAQSTHEHTIQEIKKENVTDHFELKSNISNISTKVTAVGKDIADLTGFIRGILETKDITK